MLDRVRIHPNALVESNHIGDGTRIWAFAHVLPGARIGKDCNICDRCYIEGGAVLGNGVTVKNGVSIWDGVTLEDFVFVGPDVVFTNDQYPRSARGPAGTGRPKENGWLESTIVREGATLGAGAVMLCGINVGRYAMVGAGALVTRDVPDFALVTGLPARRVGYVCMCGRPLHDAKTPACTECGRTYCKTRDGLTFA